MSLPKLDAFTGSTGTLIHTYDANWVYARTGTVALTNIYNNNVGCNDTSALSGVWAWAGDAFAAGQYAQAKIAQLDSSGDTYQGPSVRLPTSALAQGYTIDSANGDRWMEAQPGFASLFHDTGALALNNVQRIEASGSTLTYKVGATTVATVTDSTWASGSAGFLYYGTASSSGKLDDFEGGNLSVSSTTVTPGTIASGEAVAGPTLKLAILAGPIPTAEQVYAPIVSRAGVVTLQPAAIGTAEFVFVPTARLQVLPNAIATLEAVPQPTVSFAVAPSQTVQPNTIATVAAVYAPNVGRPLRRIAPPGLLVGYAVVGFGGGDTTESLNNLPDLGIYGTVAGREYNAAEPENAFKWASLHYASGVFDFAEPDVVMAFVQARSQVMAATGPLVWGQSLPSWVTGGAWSASTATAMMYDHIDQVVGRYVGQVHSWEVVNEPINNTTFWPGTIGSTYIDLAFRRAHTADPGAILITNEYGCEEVNSTSNAYYSLVQGLVAGGTPISGVGFEFHISGALNWSSVASNFARFAALGLQIYITELDVRIPTPASQTDLASQAAVYTSVVQTALAQPAVKGISTWGFTDKYSWVPSAFPGSGEALPFDATYNAKPAYIAIRDVLASAPLTVAPNAIVTAAQVFAPNVTTIIAGTVQPNTIPSAQVVYAPTVRATQIVQPLPVTTGQQVYVPSVVLVVPQTVAPLSIASGEAVFEPFVGFYIPPVPPLVPETIVSAERVYAPTVAFAPRPPLPPLVTLGLSGLPALEGVRGASLPPLRAFP